MVKITEMKSLKYARIGAKILNALHIAGAKIKSGDLMDLLEDEFPFSPESTQIGVTIKELKEQNLIKEIGDSFKITEKGTQLVEEGERKARETRKASKMCR